MRMRALLPVLVLFPLSLFPLSQAARADTFSYTLNGGASGFSGTGTLTGNPSSTAGADLITAITGTGVTGLISPGAYAGNNNLLFATSTPIFDSHGLAFTDQNTSGVYEVNLHSVGTSYFATITDNDNFTATLPVQFSITSAVTPEPSTFALLGTGLLSLTGLVRKRRA